MTEPTSTARAAILEAELARVVNERDAAEAARAVAETDLMCATAALAVINRLSAWVLASSSREVSMQADWFEARIYAFATEHDAGCHAAKAEGATVEEALSALAVALGENKP